jgi:ParB family transcriptional regulator, chromosome partitioning protein
MGKLDDLMHAAGSNAAESMGRAPRPAMHGASPAAGAPTVPERMRGVARAKAAAEIPVERIGPDPDQPRDDFDAEALGRLAESLRTRGQLQPIRVRWDEAAARYVIVCGERRWRAARMAGLATVTAIIADEPIGPGDLLALQLVENALREDLKPIEQARAFKALMDRNGWSTRQVAAELAITQSNVVRALALLDLPASVRDQVEQGTLPPATAYEVSKLADPETQAKVAARVVAEGMSRADTVAAVRRASGASSKPKGRGATKGKARKVTSRTFRVAGSKLTIENRRGLDVPAIVAALRAALDQAEAELGERSADAA